jgi:hypothetical protein
MRKSGAHTIDYSKPITHAPGPSSPRRQLFEAKYEKYMTNRDEKNKTVTR